MKIPTAAANASLAFTVDPDEAIKNSPPSNAITENAGPGKSTYGTVVFSIQSGSEDKYTYKNTSEPLKVISMSSMDVTVNMIATLSDTKMTFSTTSGFTAAKEHLYLGVQVATLSGGTATNSGGVQAVDALGAMNAVTLKAVRSNFKSIMSGGANNTVVSGSTNAAGNADAAADIPEANWTGVQYTVTGYANPAADWQIPSLAAPNLTIKWVVDKCNELTYDIGTAPSGSNYTAKFDKAQYKAGETATLYVLPKNEEAKLSGVTLNYIALKDGKMSEEKSFSVPRDGISTTAINGVYSATFAWPSDMARKGSPAGDVTTYKAPTWEVEVG
jgi:hypothetical protein